MWCRVAARARNPLGKAQGAAAAHGDEAAGPQAQGQKGARVGVAGNEWSFCRLLRLQADFVAALMAHYNTRVVPDNTNVIGEPSPDPSPSIRASCIVAVVAVEPDNDQPDSAPIPSGAAGAGAAPGPWQQQQQQVDHPRSHAPTVLLRRA